MRIANLVFVVVVSGCGPGVADFEERIGDTPYVFVSTSSTSNSITPRADCSPACPTIEIDVDRFDWNEHAIAARRQVVNHYRCKEGWITSVRLNRFEQYVIILATNELVGPMTVAQYQDYSRQHASLLTGIELLDVNSSFDGGGEKMDKLNDCTDPVPS